MGSSEDATGGSALAEAVSVETLIESVPDAAVVADVDTRQVVAANGAAGDLFECPAADLVGREVADLHPEGETEAHLAAFQRAVEEGHIARRADGRPLFVTTADGDRKPVEINARRVESADRSLVFGLFRPIGDRIQRERRLESTTSRLETLLDATPLPVAVLDAGGRVERWNRAAEETFGYAAEEVAGEPYPLFVDDEEFGELFERVVGEEGSLDGYETVHRAKDGSLVDVELSARPLCEDGAITGVVGSAIDVTDRNRRTRRLEVLHRVLRHNLRNELTVVRGLADRLTADSLAADDRREAAEKILRATDDLLDLSEKAEETRRIVRTAKRQRDPVCIVELVSTLAETIASEFPAATVEVSGPSETTAVPGQTEWSLARLLEHGLDHAEEPTVELAVRIRDRHVGLRLCGDQPLLPEGERALVENGEETALEHGSGLDVAGAYLLLTAVGGGLSIADDPPYGSTIRVELPRTDAGGMATVE